MRSLSIRLYLVYCFSFNFISCGDENSSGKTVSIENKFNGSWFGPIIAECIPSLVIEKEEYFYGLSCLNSVETDILEVQGIAGTILIDENKGLLKISPKQSSCSEDLQAVQYEYSLNDDNNRMVITIDGSLIEYSKEEDISDEGSSGLVVNFGCYDEEGIFTKDPNFISSISPTLREALLR